MVRPTVHKNQSRKRTSNQRNLNTPALRLRVDGKRFENRAYGKRWRDNNHVISPKHKLKMASQVWTEHI